MSIAVATKGGNRFQKHIVNQTVDWCMGKLMPRIKRIHINVHLRNLDDADGYCENAAIEDGDFVGASPRLFNVEINKSLSLTEMISTIIHEMVHVRQYVNRELADGGLYTKWKSKSVPQGTDYYDQPWEKEAYRLQDKLLSECLAEAIFLTDVDKNGFAHNRV